MASTIKTSYDEIAKLVAREFIAGADKAFLKKVEKTAKGGGFFAPKTLTSKNKNFILFVGKRPKFLFWLNHKEVWFRDKAKKTVYEMNSKKDWEKFYQAVVTEVTKASRNLGLR